MKTKLLLFAMGCALTIQAATVVEFDARKQVSQVSPFKNSNLALDVSAPMFTSANLPGYSGADVYCALNRIGKGVLNVGDEGASGLRVRLHDSIGGEVNGLFLFKTGGARFTSDNDLMEAGEIFTSQIQRLASAQIRFVVRDGGAFYISEPSREFVQGGNGNQTDYYSIEAKQAQWFSYDPVSSAAGVSQVGAPASPSFDNVQFAGFVLFAKGPETGESNSGVNFGVRQFTVHAEPGAVPASTAAVAASAATARPVLIALAAVPPVVKKKKGSLNILTIICDDLNDSIEGMGGHPQARTPNIDRLIKRGIRFSNAAANVPLCGPSRASLWSGLSPLTTGFYGADQQNNRWYDNPVIKQSVSLFELFTRNGYRNFATGKIHHNGHEVLSIFENPDGYPGFGHLPNFGPIPNDGKPEHKRQGVLPPWMPETLRKEGGWGDGFGPIQDLKKYGSEYEWTMFYSGTPWAFRHGTDRDPLPDEICTADMVDFLSRSHDKPFMATIGFQRPHSPWYAPQKYFDLFPLESVELTPILKGDTEDCAKILTEQHDIAQPWGWKKYKVIMDNGGDEQLRKWTQAYLACVAFVDDQVGKVLDALEASPYAENTLVIFTSDHGYHMGEKEYLFKFSPWEESVRVPLVIAGPGVAQNKECTTPVSLLDLYPTFVDFAEIQPQHRLDGFSLKPLLKDPAAGVWDGPDFSLSASASKVPIVKDQPAPASNQHFSLRTEHFRYIRCRNGEEELYDHRSDPNEWVNQVNNPEFFATLTSMRKRLDGALNKKKGSL